VFSDGKSNMATREQNLDRLGPEDRQTVDLVTAAMVDPTIHTDERMRLYEEITEILRYAHHDVHPRATSDSRRRQVTPHAQPPPLPDADGVADLLAEVLADPNLHTDTRMRLHQQISRLVRDADILA
jgi:hypothetical protein